MGPQQPHQCRALGRAIPMLGLLPALTAQTPRVFLGMGNEHGALLGLTTAHRVAAQVIEHRPVVGAVVLMSGETSEWSHGGSCLCEGTAQATIKQRGIASSPLEKIMSGRAVERRRTAPALR